MGRNWTFSFVSLALSLRLEKGGGFNRKDAKKRKVRKVQFHAVYGVPMRKYGTNGYLTLSGGLLE